MENSTKSSGIGCLSVIGIVFIILKIMSVGSVSHWSWFWVLCPFWGPYALIAFLCILSVVFASRQ